MKEEMQTQVKESDLKQCKYCDKWYSEVEKCETKICPKCLGELKIIILN